MSGTARAVRFDRYGGTEVLYLAEVPMPAPSAGEVVVEVRAAGINPGEASIRKGLLDEQFPATFPSGQVSMTTRSGWSTARTRGEPSSSRTRDLAGSIWRKSRRM